MSWERAIQMSVDDADSKRYCGAGSCEPNCNQRQVGLRSDLQIQEKADIRQNTTDQQREDTTTAAFGDPLAFIVEQIVRHTHGLSPFVHLDRPE